MYSKDMTTLYHATFEYYWQSIQKHGLGGRGKSNVWCESNPDCQYLAKRQKDAIRFCSDYPNWQDMPIYVLAINVADLDPNLLIEDANIENGDTKLKDLFEYHGIIRKFTLHKVVKRT